MPSPVNPVLQAHWEIPKLGRHSALEMQFESEHSIGSAKEDLENFKFSMFTGFMEKIV